MDVSRTFPIRRWNASPCSLAWAIRHGEVEAEVAASWLAVLSADDQLTRAAVLWPHLALETRRRLMPALREAGPSASVDALTAWGKALRASGEASERAAWVRSLLAAPTARDTWPAWAPFVTGQMGAGAEAVALLPSLPEPAQETYLLALKAAADDDDAVSALVRATSTMNPEAADRVLAAWVPALSPARLATFREDLVGAWASAAAASALDKPPELSLTLLALATRLPEDEGLALAFEVLVRADEAGPARLAVVSPFVPEALVDEATKRQRRAQSPARPRALAALAARTPHPAVRQRLFHEAYHETRFRHDVAEALCVIPLAAPFLPEDALRWTEALPATPEILALLAELAAGSTTAFAAALARVSRLSEEAIASDPAWAAALTRLAAAAPLATVAAGELVGVATRLPPPGRLPFWEALAPRLPREQLLALLAGEGAAGRGLDGWWQSALVDLAPADLVRDAVAAAD